MNTRVTWLGDAAVMQRRIQGAIEAYREKTELIRTGLREQMPQADAANRPVMETALGALDTLLEQSDTSRLAELLALSELLYTSSLLPARPGSDGRPWIMGSLPDHHARGTLNYLLDSLFWAKLSGLETAMPEKDLAAMLHFNLGSGIKTVEGSYYHCNSMLFILRDRVVEYLAVREPGLVPAFYKSVTEARDLCRRYGGFSEEGPPPVSELPNAAQLARYEAAFVRLETLATKGYLPAAVPVPEPVPVAPLAVPTSTPATVPAHARPSPAKRDAEAIFLRWWWWLVPGLLAAGGVALLWVKHRRRR